MSLVMATRASLKANPFLCSKLSTGEDILINHSRINSVKFKGGSNFGGLRMKSLMVNSCSTSNNNYNMEELVESSGSSDRHNTITVKCSSYLCELKHRRERSKAFGDGSFCALITGFVVYGFLALMWHWVGVCNDKAEDLVNKWMKISVIKIQMGLWVAEQSLERELNRIAVTKDESGSSSRKSILNDIINVLNRYRNDWISGYSCVDMVRQRDVNEFLKKLSHEEHFKFTEETLLVDMEKESMTTQRQEVYQPRNTYMMVSFLVAIPGKHKMHTINNSGDLNLAFEKLQSLEIQEINISWIPQKTDQILTLEQLEKQYSFKAFQNI